MDSVSLDLSQLLGFKISAKSDANGVDTRRCAVAIGAKVGDKNITRSTTVIGAKVGLKGN
jgi:hypothetical protein